MITTRRTSRGEWQRRAIIAETRVAELIRELGQADAEHAEGAARQEAAHAGAVAEALETARHDIVKGLKTALGCGHNPPQVRCVRCKSLAAAIGVVDEVMVAGGASADGDGAA
jgi:hypothetical protein